MAKTTQIIKGHPVQLRLKLDNLIDAMSTKSHVTLVVDDRF